MNKIPVKKILKEERVILAHAFRSLVHGWLAPRQKELGRTRWRYTAELMAAGKETGREKRLQGTPPLTFSLSSVPPPGSDSRGLTTDEVRALMTQAFLKEPKPSPTALGPGFHSRSKPKQQQQQQNVDIIQRG